jgi:hypothetical protein
MGDKNFNALFNGFRSFMSRHSNITDCIAIEHNPLLLLSIILQGSGLLT